jgi:hypothetical protein
VRRRKEFIKKGRVTRIHILSKYWKNFENLKQKWFKKNFFLPLKLLKG